MFFPMIVVWLQWFSCDFHIWIDFLSFLFDSHWFTIIPGKTLDHYLHNISLTKLLIIIPYKAAVRHASRFSRSRSFPKFSIMTLHKTTDKFLRTRTNIWLPYAHTGFLTDRPHKSLIHYPWRSPASSITKALDHYLSQSYRLSSLTRLSISILHKISLTKLSIIIPDRSTFHHPSQTLLFVIPHKTLDHHPSHNSLSLSPAKLSITTFTTYLSQNSRSWSLTKLLILIPGRATVHHTSQISRSRSYPKFLIIIHKTLDHYPIQNSWPIALTNLYHPSQGSWSLSHTKYPSRNSRSFSLTDRLFTIRHKHCWSSSLTRLSIIILHTTLYHYPWQNSRSLPSQHISHKALVHYPSQDFGIIIPDRTTVHHASQINRSDSAATVNRIFFSSRL